MKKAKFSALFLIPLALLLGGQDSCETDDIVVVTDEMALPDDTGKGLSCSLMAMDDGLYAYVSTAEQRSPLQVYSLDPAGELSHESTVTSVTHGNTELVNTDDGLRLCVVQEGQLLITEDMTFEVSLLDPTSDPVNPELLASVEIPILFDLNERTEVVRVVDASVSWPFVDILWSEDYVASDGGHRSPIWHVYRADLTDLENPVVVSNYSWNLPSEENIYNRSLVTDPATGYSYIVADGELWTLDLSDNEGERVYETELVGGSYYGVNSMALHEGIIYLSKQSTVERYTVLEGGETAWLPYGISVEGSIYDFRVVGRKLLVAASHKLAVLDIDTLTVSAAPDGELVTVQAVCGLDEGGPVTAVTTGVGSVAAYTAY